MTQLAYTTSIIVGAMATGPILLYSAINETI